MIKSFDEFVNEGIISDYRKQKEDANKEVSNSDKKFVMELVKSFCEIGLPFVFKCKNCAIVSDSVNKDKCEIDRDKVLSVDDLENIDITDIHITDNSIFRLFDDGDECVEGEYKKIWRDVWKWFGKAFDHMSLQWHGRVKVSILLHMKEPVKKELL